MLGGIYSSQLRGYLWRKTFLFEKMLFKLEQGFLFSPKWNRLRERTENVPRSFELVLLWLLNKSPPFGCFILKKVLVNLISSFLYTIYYTFCMLAYSFFYLRVNYNFSKSDDMILPSLLVYWEEFFTFLYTVNEEFLFKAWENALVPNPFAFVDNIVLFQSLYHRIFSIT